ncbi:MAG: hypothetical protein ACYTE6_02455 [Planctomycetota bacterium]|jgi:hypothetical protein
MSTCSFDLDTVLEMVRKRLGERGIDFDLCGCGCGGGPEAASAASKPQVKVVCVAPDLAQAVREMGEEARDQVVMVRVDARTAGTLDAWVETGAVKSRSEAAALFIREGLAVRASELDRLKDALAGVEEAKDRLRREARDVFNLDDDPAPA